MSIVIRKAEIEDCRGLGIIHSESWKAAYKGIIPDSFLGKITAESSEKRFVDAMSRGIERNYAAVCENRVVGFICIGKSRDDDLDDTFGEIWGIYLHPAYWRRGIGTKLMLFGLACLKDEGYERVSLWVLEKNERARRFYEKFGFRFGGTRKELDLDGIVYEIRYVRDL
ncbi:MAG TPA: GNAT family N-acetyltransferase [Clostridia bacterium]|mgnify:FL=1